MTDIDARTHTPTPPPPSAELRAALSEAGLSARVTAPDADAQYPVRITLLSPTDARQLARLIRTGTKRTLKATRTLREICEGYRIDLPGLRVEQGRITLGPIASTTQHGWPGCSMPYRRPPNSRARSSTRPPSRPSSSTLSRRPLVAAPSPYPYGRTPPTSWTWARSTPGPPDA